MKKNVENSQVTRNYFLRIIALTVMLSFFILPVKMNAQGAKANFSGSWTFNETKSIVGEGRGFRSATKMTVTQTGNNLNVDRVRTNQNGETTTTTEKYTLDGKECVNTSPRGTSKSVVTLSKDGKALNFATSRTFERNGQTTEMKSTEVWTLTDAKTLSILSTFVTQDGERKTTLVYDKN